MKKRIRRYLLVTMCVLGATCAFSGDKFPDYSQRYYDSLAWVIDESLDGEGLAAFNTVSERVENNIHWSDGNTINKYVKAHKRCLPYLNKQIGSDMPSFVFLIAYLESGWLADVGNPEHDFGYWQLIPEVIEEIRGLPEASLALAEASVRTIQTSEDLSTEAAFIHLHRYEFYFQHIAGFSEADAWMFTLVAFNWGVGNVKRLLLAMEQEEEVLSFSNFYVHLLAKSEENSDDKSLRVATEYIPNLWHIAVLLQRQ